MTSPVVIRRVYRPSCSSCCILHPSEVLGQRTAKDRTGTPVRQDTSQKSVLCLHLNALSD
ncbi:hypothetical protein SERLA73DRAFT_132421, partial [Serpula lacrymans var. lacrymans S7.3]